MTRDYLAVTDMSVNYLDKIAFWHL